MVDSAPGWSTRGAGRALLWPAAALGSTWVSHRRDAYRRLAAALAPATSSSLAAFFPAGLLNRVGVARVARIANPLGGLLGRAGALDLTTVRGMAFIDTIVVAEENGRRGDDETSLIFHELVHIVQYQVLGTLGFVHAYLGGWLSAGRSYLDNPLEVMAFDLQDRFDAGEVVDVDAEVRRGLGMR